MKFLASRIKTNFIKKRLFLDYLVYFGIISLLFAYFSSSRFFGTGADYNGYLAIFYGDEPTEPAFRLLKVINNFVNSGTVTFAFVYFVCAFAGLYLKGMLFKRYSASFILSILLYLPTIYFLHEYTQIRAAFERDNVSCLFLLQFFQKAKTLFTDFMAFVFSLYFLKQSIWWSNLN